MALGYPKQPTTPTTPTASKRLMRKSPKAEPLDTSKPKLDDLPVKADYRSQDNPVLDHDTIIQIVRSFACWTPAKEIVEHLWRECGIALAPHQIYRYDPERPAGRSLPEELVALHKEARDQYRESIADIPIANQVWRLRELQRHYDRATAELNPNPRLALEALEAAAKETGGLYKRMIQVEHTGANGSPLPPSIVVQFAPAPQIPAPAKVFQIAAAKAEEDDAIDVEPL